MIVDMGMEGSKLIYIKTKYLKILKILNKLRREHPIVYILQPKFNFLT